ncbi:MAG: PEGA domain-containing protein [Muribaculaceae bacterium]|nr:PEGA domain-containing protein [Muribaculaceae bacterium]
MKILRYTLSWVMGILIIAGASINASAKDFEATVVSDPEGATVYLNGMIVAQTTPAIISLDAKKMINKNLLFRFEKPGYESKTVIVSLDKKDVKKTPVIYGKLDKDPQAVAAAAKREELARVYKEDPTIPAGQADARVSRDHAGKTAMEQSVIRWYFDSDPRGARVFYRVISNNPAEVKNTNETYLTNTPYEETKGFSIPGLTYENSRNVTVEIKISKKGYEDQVKRYNVRQALDQQEISGFFELVPKDSAE